MDNKKTEAGECTEENGNSFDERQESSISDKSILQVSGRDNIVLINCDVTLMLPQGNEKLTPPFLGLAGSSKAGTVVKEPKRRAAPLRKEDEAPPKKKKRATSDTDKERKPKDQCSPLSKVFKNVKRSHRTRVEKEKGKKEPIPITKKTSDTDKERKPKVPCSKLATLFKNVKKSYPLIRVRIYDVEVQSSQRKDTRKWLPATFRVMDSSEWGYLTVFGKVKGKQIKKGQTIEISKVKAINKKKLWCDARSVKSSSEPVQMLDCVVNKMKQEEKFATLSEIRKGDLIKKTKVIIWKVGELQKKYNSSGEPYDFRELKVKASRSAKDVETLEAYNSPARFRFKEKQEVKVASVKYHKFKRKFQTSGDCLVEKLSDL